MQDVDLFLELAGIAGVFVGFGALIAVRSSGASDAFEVAYVRGVVFMGLLAVSAALAPVTLSRYDLGEHEVLALSGLVVVVGIGGFFAAMSRTPEWTLAEEGVDWPRWFRFASYGIFGSWLLTVLIIPIGIGLGVARNLEAALYFTDVVLVLFWTGVLLLQMVFRGRRLASAQAGAASAQDLPNGRHAGRSPALRAPRRARATSPRGSGGRRPAS